MPNTWDSGSDVHDPLNASGVWPEVSETFTDTADILRQIMIVRVNRGELELSQRFHKMV